jgi:hypothetical protein
MAFQPIHFLPWSGLPHDYGTLFDLRKGARRVVCTLWNHPIGGELRCEVDGELVRSQAGRDGMALFDCGMEWKRQFDEKGWTSPPAPRFDAE